MRWFESQIKARNDNDLRDMRHAFYELSSVIMGANEAGMALEGNREKAQSAFEEIFAYYHLTPAQPGTQIEDMDELLSYQLQPTGVMRRNVRLEKKWYRDAMGAMLCATQDGCPVALIPGRLWGYSFRDPETGERVRVNAKTAQRLKADAICFYQPLPMRALKARDLAVYCAKLLTVSDVLLLGLATLAVTLLGLLTPAVNQLLFGQVLPAAQQSLLVPVGLLLLGATLSTTMIQTAKALSLSRINTKIDISVQAATMARVMSLPASFFRGFSSGELNSRVDGVTLLCSELSNTLLTTGLSGVLSLIYFGQIAAFAPALLLPALAIIVAQLLLSVVCTFARLKEQRRLTVTSAKLSGTVYALFSGIQKIKLAGAERRAFAKWAQAYAPKAEINYRPPLVLRVQPALSALISLAGTAALYFFAQRAGLAVADYVAFGLAYGLVSGAMGELCSVATLAAELRPLAELCAPVLETAPEVEPGKQMVGRVSGNIELSNVSFRYTDDMPWVLDNLSLKIRAGQYVAIVGSTGCGKSTLLRLLLGFEKPQRGAVYYDRHDLSALNLKSLRRHIGVVMQDGKLFQGDLFSNIVVSAPQLGMEDAWRAAELAGIAEDIRKMPMGMYTIVSEGGGGISGGQRQRIMIARAVAPKPKILMLDEATSALDNITQRMVSQSLDALKCTRIVVAHRLSTIRQCDRIIVLDKGKIVQDGTYDQLMAEEGMFRQLVKRQQVEPVCA